MARPGLSKLQVKEVREQMLAEGRHPSADAVRAALGNTGSKSTIHKYLKELAGESPAASASRNDTVRSLNALVEQLAEKLHSDAEDRIRALQARYEMALRQKDAEIAELRERVGTLSAGPANQPLSRLGAGFGRFESLVQAGRSGRGKASVFSSVLASGRSVLSDLGVIRPAGLSFP
ncbi:DNA-binding protein [Massilia endophytica]|uniref:DNA-binding protein n=1 Tax=Massilia endophytica TaxID=2899220 RepID=UPI001E2E9932|nr:DNA-binding protein [Massilia endophytica]UGQ47950.1 DNA-binding protein [Massilia endophytica]